MQPEPNPKKTINHPLPIFYQKQNKKRKNKEEEQAVLHLA